MTKLEISNRFAEMWRRSRADSGKSQEYVAKALGVSKKTIQNWEDGTSSPSQVKGFEWFNALGVQPMPYYLELLHHDAFHGINEQVTDDEINRALKAVIDDLPARNKRQLLFFLYGDHGSSPVGLLELLTAYLHIPLPMRLGISQTILTGYELAENDKETSDHIKPDVDMLRRSINFGIRSALEHKKSYTILGGGKE